MGAGDREVDGGERLKAFRLLVHSINEILTHGGRRWAGPGWVGHACGV